MPTKLTIFNDALGIIGREELDSPDKENTTGRKLRSLWDTVPELLLSETDWHFARKRDRPTRAGTTPEFGYDYYYTLPNIEDRKRIYRVYDHAPHGDTDAAFEHWVEENGKLATNAEEIYLVYISWDMVKDKVGAWPDHFAARVASEMAYRAAPTLNTDRLKDAFEENTKRRKAAFAIDASSQPPKRHHPGSWAMAHRRGRYRTGQSGRHL